MEIIKVKNYKKFAEMLREKTNCDIHIEVIDRNHEHYQISKAGTPLGILCMNDGVASFAPFASLDEEVENDQYIGVEYAPMIDDMIGLLRVFRELFVSE